MSRSQPGGGGLRLPVRRDVEQLPQLHHCRPHVQQRRYAREVGGHGSSNVDFALNDTAGAVSVATGTLALQGGETFTGTATLGGPARSTSTAADRSAARPHSSAPSASPRARTRWPTVDRRRNLLVNGGTVTLCGRRDGPQPDLLGRDAGGPRYAFAASQVTWTGGTLGGHADQRRYDHGRRHGHKALTGTLTNTGTIAVTGGDDLRGRPTASRSPTRPGRSSTSSPTRR